MRDREEKKEAGERGHRVSVEDEISLCWLILELETVCFSSGLDSSKVTWKAGDTSPSYLFDTQRSGRCSQVNFGFPAGVSEHPVSREARSVLKLLL